MTFFWSFFIRTENSIEIRNVSASWEEDEPNRKTLQNIVLDVKQGQLCAIIGPVGGGKSSLMQLLLGELPIQSGTVSIQGSMSYASQKPWLFTGTVRNNILFGQIYDKRRYNEVVKCCALSTDFEQFPNGDKTIVGERGASLSGGQRARISLARAVYKAASIYLLDDPLSAVDAHVGKHLFEEVIGPKGRLAQNATRILITHQVHFLKEADVIVIIENGRVTHQGTYAELSNTDLDFAKLLQKIEEEEEKLELNDNGELYEEDDIPYMDGVSSNGSGYRAMKSRTDSISKSIGGSSLDLKDDEIEAEEQSDSKLPLRAIKQYFLAGANWWALLCLVLVMIVSQCVTSGSDYYVNFWTQQEYRRIHGEPVALTERHYLYIYAAIILAVIFVSFMHEIVFVFVNGNFNSVSVLFAVGVPVACLSLLQNLYAIVESVARQNVWEHFARTDAFFRFESIRANFESFLQRYGRHRWDAATPDDGLDTNIVGHGRHIGDGADCQSNNDCGAGVRHCAIHWRH